VEAAAGDVEGANRRRGAGRLLRGDGRGHAQAEEDGQGALEVLSAGGRGREAGE